MLFDGWDQLLRMVLVGTSAYAILLFALRLTGHRALSRLNAFDVTVSVSIGSLLANILITNDVSLAEGVLAILLLVALQLAVTWLGMRGRYLHKLLKGEPVLLLHKGKLLEESIRKQGLTEAGILFAARTRGISDLEKIEAIVLETDGSLSVLEGDEKATLSALRDVGLYSRGE
ncbi:MAG: DUF421 domain-containing protein [Pseudomonadota bacterium]|nr:DUF421 domain-containing protein [Pseudomonadota bacterium]